MDFDYTPSAFLTRHPDSLFAWCLCGVPLVSEAVDVESLKAGLCGFEVISVNRAAMDLLRIGNCSSRIPYVVAHPARAIL